MNVILPVSDLNDVILVESSVLFVIEISPPADAISIVTLGYTYSSTSVPMSISITLLDDALVPPIGLESLVRYPTSQLNGRTEDIYKRRWRLVDSKV